MPTLNWIGKDKVINYEVPYHILEHKYNYGGESENKITHGDNLLALKSLLPEYEGRVKCIYIDPPYNTGNEGWVYNDKVNSPQMKKWLGQVVGKEGEDLSRHDKWLCMMYPRLKLLKKLLSDDGAIFISIDDNEQANLKLLCDEIFGIDNFVANIPWRKRSSKSDVPYGISQDFEMIICYAKKNFRAARKIERKYYESEDFPNRPWRIGPLTKQTTAAERPNSFFTIINPKTGDKFPASSLRTWAITHETFSQYYLANRIIFPGDYPFVKISKPVMRYWKEDDVKKAGGMFGLTATSTNLPSEVGMSQDGTKEIIDIFTEKKFNFPKPSSLIQHLIGIATITDKNSIVLDSFAGSGTTAHAVLKLNAQDGGNRKFILVEMEDYAESITAERVRRVIEGYDKVAGTGGSFDFYEVGEPIFIDDNLNDNLDVEKIRAYIWYTETRSQYRKSVTDNPEYLGEHEGMAIYFHYSHDKRTILDEEFLEHLTSSESHLIYADECGFGREFLRGRRITFKKIPRDIKKF